MKTNSGFNGFDSISAKAWKQKVQADLKGGDYNELLTWLSPEGITVKPFYTSDDLPESQQSDVSREPTSWRIGYLSAPGVEDGALLAREALQKGAEELFIPFSSTEDPSLKDMLALDVPKWIDLSGPGAPIFNWLEVQADPMCHWMVDPIGSLASSGNWAEGMEADLNRVGALYKLKGESAALGIHSSLYQQAGATRVQELGYSLAQVHEYAKRAAADKGVGPLLERPVFLVTIGSEYFFEIAKIRALRRLWELLGTSLGYTGQCRIIARPSLRNKTLYDYNTNMLRTTMECMAAVLGGADLVCNLPYDSPYHHPNAFADRIGRNQLLLLRHEGYYSTVSNPADGSYYIESLTDQLGKKALELFKSVERNGGLLRQLKAHQVQKKVRESARKEQMEFDQGSLVLVGSNKYPNPSDRMKGDLQKEPFLPARHEKTLIEPLLARRISEGYEQKRLKDE